MSVLLLLLASYLLGSFPASYVVGRIRRVDLREHGSGNLGATNAFRVLGWRMALPVLAFDVLKGWVPAFFFPRLIGYAGDEWAIVFGLAAIIGHVYSVFVGFRGGKGVATSAGVFLAVAPIALLMVIAAWGLVLWWTRLVSLASVSAALLAPIAVMFTLGSGGAFWLAAALAAFVLISHRANMRRVVNGEEPRVGEKLGESG